MSQIRPPHPVLTMLEGRAVAETGRLLMSLPILRLQAKKGRGEAVMVLPGFMADDRSTHLLREFLKSIGYKPHPWKLGINRRPMMEYLPGLIEMIESITADSEKISLVGWSRGGIISREVARERPDLVEKVITIGSPVKGGVAASSIARWVQRETGLTPAQMSRLMEERYKKPISVPVRALFSKTDGVVAWRACIDDTSTDVKHFEISGSHVGMGSNVDVYRLLPRLLAEDS